MRRPLRLLLPLLLGIALGAARGENAIPELVLGAEDDAAPWSFADGSGYVNELVRTIYASQGWKLKLEVLPYARCKVMALRGELAGCFTTSQDAELAGKLLFPRNPVIAPRHQLYVEAGAPKASCDPIEKPMRVASTHGYEYTEQINRLLATGRLKPQVVMSEATGLRMLAAGRVEGALLTTDEVKRIDYLLHEARVKTPLRLLCDFGSYPGYVAFNPRHKQTRAAMEAFDRGFEQLQQSGELGRLQLKWEKRALNGPSPVPAGR
ncbi:transporter substrate-binding domain-containing protein [Pelomonas sp. SE-A7]|uniref:substrate-binding periplasmic protein n=1 Tax=Pelomonas sp. SE-A7 TaxID=3054953 RepID=UPI00259CCE77|nr:transporter substrate-binding domain-containing protein [Pelomonas sp. SE-A7]MDM4765859.1 transporter substrate-binding domain-containing protein [Pelomonas sp. SE-A7]